MLGILLLYHLGRAFSNLAKEYDKKPWVWVVISLLVYFGSQLLTGVMIGVFAPEYFPTPRSSDNIVFNLIGILIGLLFYYILYKICSYKWSKELDTMSIIDESEIETIGKI
ncbi:MAG: hypothetical protein ACRCVT_15435 [Leadbetterella sp.]